MKIAAASPKRLRPPPISVDPEVRGGEPCFAGTRVPVGSLFINLEGGVSLDEYLDAFPSVSRVQAVAVLEYAHDRAVEFSPAK